LCYPEVVLVRWLDAVCHSNRPVRGLSVCATFAPTAVYLGNPQCRAVEKHRPGLLHIDPVFYALNRLFGCFRYVQSLARTAFSAYPMDCGGNFLHIPYPSTHHETVGSGFSVAKRISVDIAPVGCDYPRGMPRVCRDFRTPEECVAAGHHKRITEAPDSKDPKRAVNLLKSFTFWFAYDRGSGDR
jgi:hypothetical protein